MSGALTYTDPQLIAQNRQYKAVMSSRNPYLTIGGNVTGSQMITVTCVEQ